MSFVRQLVLGGGKVPASFGHSRGLVDDIVGDVVPVGQCDVIHSFVGKLSGQVDLLEDLVDDGADLGAITLDVEQVDGETEPVRSGLAHARWGAWIAMVVAFALGRGVGLASSAGEEPAETDPPVVAGHMGTMGAVSRVSATTGMVPMVVSLYGSGPADVPVIAAQPTGWHPDDLGEQDPVTVPSGGWRNIVGSARLDCGGPAPSPVSSLEVLIGAATSSSTIMVSLPRQAEDLVIAWHDLCPLDLGTLQPDWLFP